MCSSKNSVLELNSCLQAKRKRLGQYFTGSQLARLLVALAHPKDATTVIDPMCGTGDMLKAASEYDPKLKLTGIEIDNEVLNCAESNLRSIEVSFVEGSAFEYTNIERLGKRNYDLVITNPPYVRYQTIANLGDSHGMPNASEIRKSLLNVADALLEDIEDRRLFKEIIQSYSGLSDLAVPSMILAAILTKVGGTIALVVPESWLSRDYARVIQYMLFRWFKVRYIVEDTNASWFPDAMVKTTLLIAERIDRRESAFMWQDEFYAHVRISAKASSSTSVVGSIFPGVLNPEKKFANELYSLLSKNEQQDAPLWSLECVRLSDATDNLINLVASEPWLKKCENIGSVSVNGVVMPVELRRLLKGDKCLRSLEQNGVYVGQGLRTGANPFFYVDLIKKGRTYSLVKPNKIFSIENIYVPEKCMLPVLRKQSELPTGYRVKKTSLKGRVLILRNHQISGGLTKVISAAKITKIGKKLIPELSAVRTNVRYKGTKQITAARWYILPDMSHRHTPSLLVPRINGGPPRTYANSNSVIVDANFSAIWFKPGSIWTQYALLAFLNSSWSVASMELAGSIMGGGALKLEATHLKRIPVPDFNAKQILKLNKLGLELEASNDSHVLWRIDKEVAGALFKEILIPEKLKELQLIIHRRLSERKSRI